MTRRRLVACILTAWATALPAATSRAVTPSHPPGGSALAIGQTQRVSVSDAGLGSRQGVGPSDFPRISGDGSAVGFISQATNLVEGDTNGRRDVFVHERPTRRTVRVSVSTSEGQADGDSGRCHNLYGLDMTGDGRLVAFISSATNLVPGDTNGACDDFVRDRASGTTIRVSLPDAATGNTQANGFSGFPSIGAGGRLIAFFSTATNLTVGGSGPGVFVRDVLLGTTAQVAPPDGGTATYPAISRDGRFVAFVAPRSGISSIWVYDRELGTYDLASQSSSGQDPNGASSAPSLSADGRYVSFSSQASNLVPGDGNGEQDVFVRDRLSRTTERASVASDGTQANGKSRLPRISADGRFVAYQSFATNLVPGDTNGTGDVFLRDLEAGVTTRVSVPDPSVGGLQGNGNSSAPSVSAHGESVAFDSIASNLVLGDTNQAYDVFAQDG